MTKQEEIRASIENKLRVGIGKGETIEHLTRWIISYLHSQDVAIKVDRIPQCGEPNLDASVAMSYDLIKKAGYVAVEPLIEVKHDTDSS